MNMFAKLTSICIFLFFNKALAQNVTIQQSDFINYQSANYIGSNTQFHYFSAFKEEKYYLLKTNVTDLKLAFEEVIAFKDPEETFKEMFVDANYLYKLSYIGHPETYTMTAEGYRKVASTVKAINLYKYNALNNELINKEVIKINTAITYIDEPRVYEKQHLILIQSTYYDYNFKELTNKKMEVFSDNTPHDSLQIEEKTYVRAYAHFPQMPYLVKGDLPIKTQELEKEIFGFKVNYEGTTDNSVAVFKTTLHNIKVKSKFGILNDINIKIPDNKKIIDLHFKTNANKELIVLGKFAEVNEKIVKYGFFTMKYDSNLNDINDVRYTPVIETNIKNKGLKESIYFALFFNTLEESFYYDVMGINTQIFFFQHTETNIRMLVNYNVVGDDIFVLIINKIGELKINRISLKQNSRLLGYCKMQVCLVGKKVYLVYYDHKNNINKSENEVPTLCELAIENTVMLGTTIDLETLEMTPKKVLFSCNQYKAIPPTFPFASYYNGYFDSKIFFSFKDGYIYQFTFN